MTEIRLAVPPEIDRYLEALVRTGPFGSKAELVRAAIVSYAQEAGPLAHDFDKENLFSPDGRIYQIEYARESARRGLPIAGAVFEGGVVLGANYHPGGNPTLKLRGKIVRLSPQVLIASTGLVADARAAVRHLRRQSWRSCDELLDDISRLFFEHTVRRDVRPLGCALLLASTLGKEPRLVEVDASGALSEVEADVVGAGVEEDRTDALKGYRVGKRREAEATVGKLLRKELSREVASVEV